MESPATTKVGEDHGLQELKREEKGETEGVVVPSHHSSSQGGEVNKPGRLLWVVSGASAIVLVVLIWLLSLLYYK
jgi:hypothetical protein